ncbi:MAG: helix-turn-helix domain-containing protein [Clostridia bacterium]
MDYYEKLRILLKKRRLELNMMQTEVAEKADISNNFYSNIERGKTKPSVETLFKICKALNLSLDEIIFEEEMSTKDIYIKETVRNLDKIFKDGKSAETIIEFCNSFTSLLRKLKEDN